MVYFVRQVAPIIATIAEQGLDLVVKESRCLCLSYCWRISKSPRMALEDIFLIWEAFDLTDRPSLLKFYGYARCL